MADKWQELQEEVKLLKNEIKQVLMDIKEKIDTPGSIPMARAYPIKSAPLQAEKASGEEDLPMEKEEPVNHIPAHTPGGNGKKPLDAPAAITNVGSASIPAAILPVGIPPALTGKPNADLITVGMLSQWLAHGVRKVGRQRMAVLVDVYSQLGGFPPAITDVLMKLLNNDEGDGQAMKEGVSILVEVDNLLHRSLYDRNEAAVLSLFLNGNGNGKEASHR